MMGTVWLRMGTTQEHIQPFINAIVSPGFPETVSTLADLPQVLRIGFYELHGRGIRARLSRRPGYLYQGTRQWSLWRNTLHAGQLSDWTSFSLYAPITLVQNAINQPPEANQPK